MNDGIIAISCLACGQTLMRTGPLDNEGSRGVLKGEADLKYDPKHDTHFRECPHCHAKNGFREVGAPPGRGTRLQLDQILG